MNAIAVRGALCLAVASVMLAGYSLTSPQALSGPAASETVKTQFAELATVVLNCRCLSCFFELGFNWGSRQCVYGGEDLPPESENIFAEADSTSIVVYLIFLYLKLKFPLIDEVNRITGESSFLECNVP